MWDFPGQAADALEGLGDLSGLGFGELIEGSDGDVGMRLQKFGKQRGMESGESSGLFERMLGGGDHQKGLCRKFVFGMICAMVSPGDLPCTERESGDGDQFQGGPFPTRYHSHGRALVCGVSLKLSACRRTARG